MGLDYLGILLRWMHVLAAITAVGGTIFMRAALLPSVSVLADDQRKALHEGVRSRWVKFVMAAIAFLLISGFYNFVMKLRSPGIAENYKGLYHGLFGVKFLLALGVFFLASALTGRSPALARFRQNAKFWLTVNLVLAVLVVCISGVLRAISTKRPTAASVPTNARFADVAGTEYAGAMEKKAKKRLDLLNQRLQKLRMQLAGARKQMDDPADVNRLEREVGEVASEIEKLKQSG